MNEYALDYKHFDGLDTYAVNRTFRVCDSFKYTYTDKRVDAIFGKLLDEIKPDVVHIHHLMFLSHGIISEAKKRNIPVIFMLHDYWLLCYRGQLINSRLTICEDDSIANCQDCLKYMLKIKRYSIFFYFLLRRKRILSLLLILKKLYFWIMPDGDSIEKVQSFKEGTKKILNDVDLFIAPSSFIKNKFIENGILENRIIYQPYGFDKSNISYNHQKDACLKNIRFGYMGTLLPMKGIDVLISAFKEIKHKDINLSIYGKIFPYSGFEGYPRFLKNISKSDGRIRFMGGYNNHDVGIILSSIDVLVVPSIWLENAPLVIQEAFLVKIPVIASRIGGIPELVRDNINGLLFNAGDADDLKEKIEYIIDNPGLINKFKSNMPEVKSIEDNTKEMELIYYNLVSGIH